MTTKSHSEPMATCPCGGTFTKETRGAFDRSGRFVADRTRRWYIRTTCTKCGRFYGFRPVERKKAK